MASYGFNLGKTQVFCFNISVGSMVQIACTMLPNRLFVFH